MTDTFSLSIASLGVLVHCTPSTPVGKLQQMYQDYPLEGEANLVLEIQLCGKEPSSVIQDSGTCFQEGVLYFTTPGFEGTISEQEGTGELHISSNHPVESIDYALRAAYALLAYQAGGVMIHAAGLIFNGLAYLFFGHSGAGKTTVSHLSTNCSVLNDDLVLLLPDINSWRAYGTPFWNPSQVKPTATSAPIKGVFRLEKAKQVRLEPLSSSKAVAELVANVPILSIDPTRSSGLLERLYQITQAIPVKTLYFRPDASFWKLIENQTRRRFQG